MRIVLLILFFIPFNEAISQHSDTTKIHKIVDFFKEGHLSGQIRNFTMSTINSGSLNDYIANAIGASIHYETAEWKGIKFGLNGLFVYKTFSNNLLEIDTLVGKPASYELQLFDIEHLGNYNDLDRLEELYIHYSYKNWNTTLGKMEIETPIVNKHDGRMKPKVFLGLKSEYRSDKFGIFGGWFWKASPRSTTHWYNIGDAIGLYNNGCLPDGSNAEYHEHISSKGLGIFGLKHNLNSRIEVEYWNYHLENISNTLLINPSYDDSTWYFGLMYLNQVPMKSGGSENIEHTFHNPSLSTNALSARIGYSIKKHGIQINGTHVFKKGAFIFPRELGMDPFYTFISRSQIEGAGNSTAFTLGYKFSNKNLQIGIYWNRMLMSSDLRYNKYDIPSYDQFNFDFNYKFSKKLIGLEMKFLYVWRNSIWKNITPTQVFNKVNFHQFNLIFNYNF